jgi:cytochrome P450
VTLAPAAPGRLPGIGHLAGLLRDPLRFMASLSAAGDVVEIRLATRSMYVVTAPDLVRAMLVEESANCTRGFIYDKARPVLGDGLLTAEGESHRRQRRLLQPAFHRQQVTRYVEAMAAVAEQKAGSWRAGQLLALNEEMHELALDMVLRVLLCADLDRSSLAAVRRCMDAVVKGIVAQAAYPSELFERLPIPVNRRYAAAGAELRRIVAEMLRRRRAAGPGAADLLGLLAAGSEGDPRTDEARHREEIVTLLIAGTETASITLAWMFHELGRHPAVETRLRAELTPGGHPVDPALAPEQGYARQVLNEVLRLHTPNWILMRRTVRPMTLGGVALPAGADLIFSLTTLHRDPRTFDDPMAFDPDRWSPARAGQVPRNAFMPFGAGRHKCIGDAFASSEILVALATILGRWRLVPAGGRVREVPWTTVQPRGLVMRLAPAPGPGG